MMHWLNTLQMHNFHQTELRLQQQQAIQTQAQATDTQTTQIDPQASKDDPQASKDDPPASKDDPQASKDELESTSTSSLVEKMVTIGGENERTEEEKLTNFQ